MAIDFSRLATDRDDAAARAARFSNQDPLPDVPCSLLSSAEIYDYARLTGMLHPFYQDSLKSASYEAHLGGEVILWDEHGKHKIQVVRGDTLILKANSITFAQVEPEFRLPNYIAIRFNLRITHVHRGLLLGTGPLVDPGFEGKLLIPLHNLTSSDYPLNTLDALIWIEFTKTSYGFPKNALPEMHLGRFVSFPEAKKNMTPDQYLMKASAGSPIKSSIPDAIDEGRRATARSAEAAERAEGVARGIRRTLTIIGLPAIGIALGGLGVALVALYIQVSGLVQDSHTLSTSVVGGLSSLAAESKSTAIKADALRNELADALAKIQGLQQQIEKQARQIEDLERRTPPDSHRPPQK
jgi:deoxycytidine triphosphate deaminase